MTSTNGGAVPNIGPNIGPDIGQDISVGLISVGWMGKLHTRAYQALPTVYPELGLRPRLVHAADTAPDRH
jgi:hypothetical protein